jgi:hypothetical protein
MAWCLIKQGIRLHGMGVWELVKHTANFTFKTSLRKHLDTGWGVRRVPVNQCGAIAPPPPVTPGDCPSVGADGGWRQVLTLTTAFRPITNICLLLTQFSRSSTDFIKQISWVWCRLHVDLGTMQWCSTQPYNEPLSSCERRDVPLSQIYQDRYFLQLHIK